MDKKELNTWGNAIARLVELNASERFWDLAHLFAVQFAEGKPEGWSINDVALHYQINIVGTLMAMQSFRHAEQLTTSLRNELDPLVKKTTDVDFLLDYSLILSWSSDIALTSYGSHEARKYLIKALKIHERIIDKYKQTPNILRDLAILNNKIGDLDYDSGKLQSARKRHIEALNIHKKIIDEYEQTSQTWRDLAISNLKLGDLDYDSGKLHSARKRYIEALNIHKKIIDEYEQTPQIWRELAISYEKMGDAYSKDFNDTQDYKHYYREALRIHVWLIEVIEQPPPLRYKFLSSFPLEKIEDVDTVEQHFYDVRSLYSKYLKFDPQQRYRIALKISQKIATSFDEPPQVICDLERLRKKLL